MPRAPATARAGGSGEEEELGAGAAGGRRALVMCCGVEGGGLRFARFAEGGALTYELEGEALEGVFVKVAGPHCGQHFPVAGAAEAVAQLRAWVAAVPDGATVLVAALCLARETLPAVLLALAPLGSPQAAPPRHAQRALAAVLRRGKGSAESACCACHASGDVAYAAH